MMDQKWKGSGMPEEGTPREGDLYKIITAFGKTFELRYGYYDDRDRIEAPDIIYPDFTEAPLFTESGAPFVTMMQDACDSFEGKTKRTEDSMCSECFHFCRGEELIGICQREERREIRPKRQNE